MDFSELVYLDSTGYHFADYPTILEWMQQQYRDIYGADVYIEPDSQDGQWIAVQAKALYDSAALGAAIYASFSPSSAQGVGLARNVKINGITKRPATMSTVDLLIVGQAGTVIGIPGSPGSAVDSLDQIWQIPVGTVIPGGGSITVTATAEKPGAIQAASNTVDRIFTPTRGWQTVNNPTAAFPGVAVESDAQLRERQKYSVANPSKTVLVGTVGAVANLPGVVQAVGYENDTNITDGNGIPAHSISVAVIGGDVTEICETILLHKTPGCGTYGNTSEVVSDPKGMPINISFERPVGVTIEVGILIAVNAGYSSSYEELIKEALSSAIDSLGIGTDVLLTKLYIPAYLQGTPAFGTFDVVSIEIARSGDPLLPYNAPIDWNEYAECTPSDVVVTTS